MKSAKRCVCGAVTVSADGEDFSYPYKEFKELYPDLKLDKEKYSNCNYCVNHWGSDLCKCGSGKKVGKCSCKSKKSSQFNYKRGTASWV